MNQHPVPQNVTQYQFRLVGDMTLKQFLELAAGLILAVLFYSSNLLFIFKAPLILLSIFFGIALAFFPIEDRPLDQWIINFLNSIYKPTRFIWKKTNKIPIIFTFVAHPIAATNTITKTIKAPTINHTKLIDSDLSETENTQIKSLNNIFSATPVAPISPSIIESPAFDKPSITVRKLSSQQKIDPQILSNSTKTASSISIPTNPIPKLERTSQPKSEISSPPIPDKLIFSQTTTATTKQAAPAVTKLKTIQLPVAPRSPNLIVGVTTSPEGKLLENVIVQVIDQSGIPARALKTNALGQFATSTPLNPGTYRIEAEQDGHTFPSQQLVINDSIIQPFEISATS